MIKYTRGKIEILDVEGLREIACECYETVIKSTTVIARLATINSIRDRRPVQPLSPL